MYKILNSNNQETNYKHLEYAIADLLETENDIIAILSNISAFINAYMDNINWVGFYIAKEDQLILGPFQGLPACIRIPNGKGVCGTAMKNKSTMLIEDVNKFPGHIACDSASNSELVVPILIDDKIFGVLDIDSPNINRFSINDKVFFEKIIELLVRNVKNKI